MSKIWLVQSFCLLKGKYKCNEKQYYMEQQKENKNNTETIRMQNKD
jgi:hypothetical protein